MLVAQPNPKSNWIQDLVGDSLPLAAWCPLAPIGALGDLETHGQARGLHRIVRNSTTPERLITGGAGPLWAPGATSGAPGIDLKSKNKHFVLFCLNFIIFENRYFRCFGLGFG